MRLKTAQRTRREANKKRVSHRAIWTLDCETDPFEPGVIPEPFLWGLYDGEHDVYRQFETADAVAEFIRGKEILIYAHNGGKFDYHYMKPHFNSDERIMVIGQRIARFRIGEAELRDSTNLLPVPLADFQKSKIDYSIMRKGERDKPHNRRIIEVYLKSDCVNLYNFVREFQTRYGTHLTQAGAALRYWSETYHVTIPRQSPARFQELRPYYYGGRVQCFTSGYLETSFKVLDINSAYPYAMKFKHPFSVGCDVSTTLPVEREKLETCLIRLKAVAKGCFPLRAEDGSLYFPSDETQAREYTVTGWELLAALETDTVKVIKIHEVRTFDQLIDFGDYVDHFYSQRQEAKAIGDKAGDVFAKIFLNSLYGKFAANPEKYQEYMVTAAARVPEYQGDGYVLNSDWDQSRVLLCRPLREGRRRYYNLATAASITGFVRAYLWRAVQRCSGVLYCDTDSIAARDTGTLALGEKLGQWKTEMNCDRYAIAGKKLYAFHDANWKAGAVDSRGELVPEWKVACKGVKLTAEQIIRVAKREAVKYVSDVPTYSVHRPAPIFIPRNVIATARDISLFPEPKPVTAQNLGRGRKAA